MSWPRDDYASWPRDDMEGDMGRESRRKWNNRNAAAAAALLASEGRAPQGGRGGGKAWGSSWRLKAATTLHRMVQAFRAHKRFKVPGWSSGR